MFSTTFETACDVLPIYRLDQDLNSLFYTPGYLVVVGSQRADEFAKALGRPEAQGEAGELTRRAAVAVTELRNWWDQPFEPVCLTLFLHDGCNLNCSYCVSDPMPRPTKRLLLEDVRSATSLVLANCQRLEVPFTVVCHGGGEPTLDPGFLFEVLDALDVLAAESGVPVLRYLATNGVMSQVVARAVAARFDLIGLSCDGPESVQSVQRPLRSKRSSAPFVEATADAVHAAGTPLHVRTTVLPHAYQRLPEITEYICRRLRPAEMTAEPIYVGGRATSADCATAGDVAPMVDAFLAAEAIARSYAVSWTTTGSRLGEIHGPYCNVFRSVLNLVPGGVATACFKTQDASSAAEEGVRIGAPTADRGRFVVDAPRISALREELDRWPGCHDCFDRFHCVRTCPDHCPIAGPVPSDSFRCRFQKTLTTRRLQREAAALDRERTTELAIVL